MLDYRGALHCTALCGDLDATSSCLQQDPHRACYVRVTGKTWMAQLSEAAGQAASPPEIVGAMEPLDVNTKPGKFGS